MSHGFAVDRAHAGDTGGVKVQGLTDLLLGAARLAGLETMVHVAEGDEGNGFACRLGLGDRYGQIRIAVVPLRILAPVFAAEIVRSIAQTRWAVVADDQNRLTGRCGDRPDNPFGRFRETMDAQPRFAKLAVFPFGPAPAKGPRPDDAQAQVRKILAAIAHMAIPQQIQLRLHPIFLGTIVGAAGFALGGDAVPGVVVAHDGGFGQIQLADLPHDVHGFVAVVPDE